MTESYQIISAPKIIDDRGILSFVEFEKHLDFIIKRAYWLYDFKQNRGGHAHKKLKQFIFCISGSVELILDDTKERCSIVLNEPSKGVIITKPLWRELINFDDRAIVVVLASETYSEADYIRSYDQFKQYLDAPG